MMAVKTTVALNVTGLKSMILYLISIWIVFLIVNCGAEDPTYIVKLTDEKWDQIQKGQWLIGFFDKDTEESERLEKDWSVFASKLNAENINVGHIFAPENPGLYVRFLVTSFPKVFYIRNGVAHEVQKVNRNVLVELIKDKQWHKLKPVGFLSNPFSIQMLITSNLFIHAVNLYNFENSIVQNFISAPSATDFVFGLTFIIVGTTLGLFLTCAFGLVQVLLAESPKDSNDKIAEKKKSKAKDEDKLIEKESDSSSEETSSVRKRK